MSNLSYQQSIYPSLSYNQVDIEEGIDERESRRVCLYICLLIPILSFIALLFSFGLGFIYRI